MPRIPPAGERRCRWGKIEVNVAGDRQSAEGVRRARPCRGLAAVPFPPDFPIRLVDRTKQAVEALRFLDRPGAVERRSKLMDLLARQQRNGIDPVVIHIVGNG